MAAKLNAKIISSLEKCFHDEALSDHPRLKKASMLRNGNDIPFSSPCSYRIEHVRIKRKFTSG